MTLTQKKCFSAKRRFRGAFCAIQLLFCAATLPHALSTVQAATASKLSEQDIAYYGQLSEGHRVRLLIQLAKSGNQEEAAALLAHQPLTGPLAQNRTLYIEGLILKGRGKLTSAAENFRKALANDPKLTLVRSDLAETLYALEEDESAKHHLERLAADAPDAEAAKSIRSFIDQIDARRPYKFDAYVSLAPTTNVNTGTRNKTVYSPLLRNNLRISEASREKSAVGVAIGANAAYSKRVGEDLQAVVAGNGEALIYDDKDFNAFSLSQSAELRRLTGAGYVSLGAVGSQSFGWDGMEPNFISYGPRVAITHALNQQNAINFSTRFEWRDYQGENLQDGTAVIIDAAFTHAFDSSFSATISGGFDSIDNKLDILSYDTWSAGLSIYKELPKGITVNASADVRLSEFDAMNPIALKTRKDTKLTGTIALTKRDLNFFGFAPTFEYTYIYNDSNIALYQYDSHAVDFRLTKEF